MLNRGLLISSSKKLCGIGVPGKVGFGVGVYTEDPADLVAMGLTPMPGVEDPTNPNYGNYQHANGSVMVFIPKFYYKYAEGSASYAPNSLCITSFPSGGGWVLHRAFIDGGVEKSGFFVDKYLCSKSSKDQNIPVSIKSGNQISLGASYETSSTMNGCTGKIVDAITLGRSRGDNYSCMSGFQFSALAMIAFAHAQASNSPEACAWYDEDIGKRHPKGSNTVSLVDVDDTSVIYQSHDRNPIFGKTGSASIIAKTTHNGQNCGVADVNGVMCQVISGLWFRGGMGQTVYFAKKTVRMHDLTKESHESSADFISKTLYISDGQWYEMNRTYDDEEMTGILPHTTRHEGNSIFGFDTVDFGSSTSSLMLVGGQYDSQKNAGVFCRNTDSGTAEYYSTASFRVAGYAN